MTLLNDSYLPVLYGLTEHWFETWGLAEDESLLSDLLCGDEKIVSVEIIYSAIRLAEAARGDADLASAFASLTAEEIWAAIEKGELSESFCHAVRSHLHAPATEVCKS